MAEEIDFENGRNSNFEGLVTLTLTFDPAIRHTVVHHSSTSTYIPNFIQIEETFCGRTDVRTDGRTDIFPLYTIRSTFGSRPKNGFPNVIGAAVISGQPSAGGRAQDRERSPVRDQRSTTVPRNQLSVILPSSVSTTIAKVMG